MSNGIDWRRSVAGFAGLLGPPLGWYISMDIGELNQVVHLWGYESLADRASRRGGWRRASSR